MFGILSLDLGTVLFFGSYNVLGSQFVEYGYSRKSTNCATRGVCVLRCLYLIVLGWGRAWVLKYAFRTMLKLHFGVRSRRRHGRKVSCFLSGKLSSFLIKTQWANHSFTLGDHVHSRLRDMVTKHRQTV